MFEGVSGDPYDASLSDGCSPEPELKKIKIKLIKKIRRKKNVYRN